MILYCFLFVTSISLQAFFSPNQETIEKWDELLYSENPARIKQYIQNHPDEIKYGLQRLNSLKDDKENKIAGNEMGPEDWKRFLGGSILTTIGTLVLTAAIFAMRGEQIMDELKDVIVIAGSGAGLVKGIELVKNSLEKKYSQDSLDRVKAMKCELLDSQEKKK